MKRRLGTGDGSGELRAYTKDKVDPDKPSKLDEKRQKLQSQKSNVQVKSLDNVSDMESEKIKYSKRNISDEEEVPTGILDEDDDEETPTGFLDEPVERTTARGSSQRQKRIKVVEVPPTGYIPPKAQVERPSSTVERPSSTVGRRQPSGAGRRQEPQGDSEWHDSKATVPPKARPALASKGFTSSEDVPPIRKEDEMPIEEPKRGGSKAVVVIGIVVAVLVVAVVGFSLLSGTGILNVSTEPGVSESGEPEIRVFLDSLYTDETKTDILEDVTTEDISTALDLIQSYSESSLYNSEEYDSLSGEISTISFFLQDRLLYQDLLNGVYESGSDDYMATLNTIKSDIELYTVQGLADTMNSRVNILEVSGGVGLGSEPASESESQAMSETQPVLNQNVPESGGAVSQPGGAGTQTQPSETSAQGVDSNGAAAGTTNQSEASGSVPSQNTTQQGSSVANQNATQSETTATTADPETQGGSERSAASVIEDILNEMN